MTKFGPTGDYPHGSLGPHDEGGLTIGVAHDSKGNIIINFGTKLSWIGLPPEQAVDLARLLLLHAGVYEMKIKFGTFEATSRMGEKDDGRADKD
jgi:hypothetical protein